MFYLLTYLLTYRKHYFTETALVKVHNDIVTAIDKDHVGALAMLDLSSAF